MIPTDSLAGGSLPREQPTEVPAAPTEPMAQPANEPAPTPAPVPTAESVPPLSAKPETPPFAPQPQPQEVAPVPSTPPPTPSIPEQPRPNHRSLLAKALEAIQFRRRAKLEKIMKLAQAKGSVTNDQAQRHLGVSDATATRYLSDLVRQGRLRRVGTTTTARYEPTLGSNGGN